MVESANAAKSREDIKNELFAYADEQIAKWDNMKEIAVDKAPANYEARQTWNDDGPLTVVKYKCDGLTQEQVDSWFNDPL